MKKLFLIAVSLLSLPFGEGWGGAFAQDQHLTDSLQTQLKQLQGERTELRNNTPSIRDSSIAKILIKLCTAYQNNNPDKAMDYGKQSLTLCEQIAWKKGIGSACNSIGIVYKNQSNYPEALKNYFAALKIYEEIGNKKGIASTYRNIGNVYFERGNSPEALKNHFVDLKMREEMGDKEGLGGSYINIGNVYYFQHNYPEALKNYFAALKIMEEIGGKEGIAYAYSNIGAVYAEQGNNTEALKNYFASLKINEETGNKYGIATNYRNTGNVYYRQGNYSETLKNYFAALKINEELGNKERIALSQIDIGEVYTKLNRAKEAKTWLQKGLALSKDIGQKERIKDSYNGLAVANSALGNYKGALENYKLYTLYKDSLFNEENSRKITQQQMQMDFDKKQAIDSLKIVDERKINEIKFKQEKTQRYALYGGLVLLALFGGFMFNRFRVTQRQKTIIEQKEHETQKQKKIIEEHHKEIKDSINYAERIQRSLLASKDLLDENLNRGLSHAELVSASQQVSDNKTLNQVQGDPSYFVFFKPKNAVSGDFYWASSLSSKSEVQSLKLPEHQTSNSKLFALITADSTGHGVPGAIMSILNIACLNEAVKEGYTSPADILNRTRKEIISVLKHDGSAEGGKDGMDCSLCVYDFANMKLYVAAANNPVWIVRASGTVAEVLEATETDVSRASTSEVIEFKPDKMPVGKHDKQDIPFTQQEIDLQKGDVIYTLTDGFSDQFGGQSGKKFMSKNLRELLAANSHLPMLEQKQLLETTFQNWIGDLEQVDDVCVIGVRV